MNKKQKSTPEQNPFDYNAKIMSLTKAKIVSINQNLNVVIEQMQKEIDLYKEKYNQEKNNYFLKTKENSNLKRDIDSTKDYSERISKQYNLLKETNNEL